MTDAVFVLGGAISSSADMIATMQLPKFRKATRAMGYAYAALKAIVDRCPAIIAPEQAARVGIVLGSSHGELDVTTQFLDHIGKSNIARPILFQNSLHNSTLGFLTVEMQFVGPAITVSNGQVSGEDAVDTALLMLRSGDCDLCFAIGYDLWVPAVENVRNRFYPQGLERGEGAAVVLLATATGVARLNGGLAPMAELRALDIDRIGVGHALTDCAQVSQPFYDANGIAAFVEFLYDPDRGANLMLQKPDGAQTRFVVERL